MRGKKGFLLVFGVLGLLGVLGTCPVFGASWKTLPGHVPRELSSLTAIGQLAATNQLRLAIGVPLRDPAGLDAFLAQVYGPASLNYRQFLTPEEFTARFGPTEADYEAVKTFARTNGLKVIETYGNRLVLDVSGPAVAVGKAFHVTLHVYRHPTEARDFFAPDTEPMVDAALPVVDIQGMSDFSRPHPRLHRMDAAVLAKVVAKSGSSPDGQGAYFGDDFRNAYVLGTTLTGAGQSVGLLEADGFYAGDIAAYAAAAGSGRTNIVIQTILLDGFNGAPTSNANGNSEVSLDIEVAMAMAPGLAKIIVYEGNPNQFLPNDILNSMLAGSNTVKNLSCSWGWNGVPYATMDTIFKNMAAVGQSFFNASGDSDAFTTGTNSVNGVDNLSLQNSPSSNPYITQVGGTSLTTTGANAAYSSETVWNRGGGTGSSGGISSDYAIPTWQTNVSNMAGRGGSTTKRNIPDVAMTAEYIYIAAGNGSGNGEVGGTSCAAPLWAGFTALVNQQASASGQPLVGFINPAIYVIASGPNYATCFHDITAGNNYWSSSPGLFSATNGYDLCTGLGTPAGQSLINLLANGTNTLIILPQLIAATGVAGGPFSLTSANFLLTNASSSPLTWSLVSTSAWLTISATNGTLAAAATTNLTASFTATASNLMAATYSANLIFSNITSHSAQSALFTLQANQPLVVSPTNGFITTGPVGGAFGVTSQNYSLTNQSGSSLPWSIINAPSWLSASPVSGTLASDAQTNVTISLTAVANSLAAGAYTANVLVTNNTGVAAVLPFTISVGVSSVVNGGFETGDFTGWTETGSMDYMTVSASASYVHSGAHGAKLGPASAMSYLSQNLVTSPGANYLLSCWLVDPSTKNGNTPNQFLVQWNGTTIYNQINQPAMGWTNLQFLVTATAAITPLQFGFQNDPAFFGFDDVSVTPVAPISFESMVKAVSNFQLVWNTTTGIVYQVQYKTNLLQTSWINLGSASTAKTNKLMITDTNAFLASPQRFYRLFMSP